MASIPALRKNMKGDGDLGRFFPTEMLGESRFHLGSENFSDGAFPFDGYFREDDSENGAFFIPADEVGLALGDQNDVDRLFQNRRRRAIFQIGIEEHQDERLAGTLRAPALERQHGVKDILREGVFGLAGGVIAIS